MRDTQFRAPIPGRTRSFMEHDFPPTLLGRTQDREAETTRRWRFDAESDSVKDAG